MADRDLLKIAVLNMCAQKPMSVKELSRYLGRSSDYLQRRFLRPMVKEGLLAFQYPDRPVHPDQRYVPVPRLPLPEIPSEAKPKKRSKNPKLPF